MKQRYSQKHQMGECATKRGVCPYRKVQIAQIIYLNNNKLR